MQAARLGIEGADPAANIGLSGISRRTILACLWCLCGTGDGINPTGGAAAAPQEQLAKLLQPIFDTLRHAGTPLNTPPTPPRSPPMTAADDRRR